MKVTTNIIEETQREAMINRPHNDFGSVKPIAKDRFCIYEDKIIFQESSIIPALIKIFMEAVDNPIDIAIKHKLKSLVIDIHVDSESISVKDNGPGIPNIKCDIGEYIMFKAFCKYNTSSNYKEFRNQGQKGVNGKGIKGSNTLSTKFIATSDDGKLKVTVTSTENNLHHEVKESKSSGTSGVSIKFYPDFKIINGAEKIDEDHIIRMYEYVLMQSLTYPDITFKFNGKKVVYTPKKFVSLFNKTSILEENENYFFGVLHNEFDDFKQLSFVNGLETSKGGTHIDYLVNNIVSAVREKLVKKYKSIKPADVRNKLTFIMIAKDVKDIDWDGQTKESITTPNKYWIEYFKDVDFNKLVNKIIKTPEIIDPITEVYKIKEEFKLRQELKNAEKPEKKKPKDEKLLTPIGEWNRLLLCEGDSASASLSKILGRQGNGFYAMFGVPPNAFDMDMKDLIQSDKMKALQGIIGLKYSQTTQDNINFNEIIIATDADLPGFFIRGQLLGLFARFGKNLFDEGKIKILRTPVIVGYDSKENIIEWFYDAEDLQVFEKANPKTKLTFEWKKGLASWDQKELQFIIKEEGLDNMLETMVYDDKAFDSLNNWLNGKMADKRKEMLDGFEFNIVNL